MKRNLLIASLVIAIGAAMLAIALYIPTALPAHTDFSALYNTDLALVHRVSIYDLPKVETLAQRYSGLPAEKFFLARFPYPPWYALSTFYLGLLPAKAAATLWFELNLAMLFLSVWLLTDGWDGRARLIAFPLALFFFPVLGALSVGQYDFPTLLGVALSIYAVKKENVALTTLGAVLLTFKPHVGALVLAALLVWLFYSAGSRAPGSIEGFGRRALRSIGMAALLLFLSGFIADQMWVISYPEMLLNYQTEGNVSACSECASLPIELSRSISDGSLGIAVVIGLVLFVMLALAFSSVRRFLMKSPVLLLTSALLINLLVSPYLYNYDFLLLLVPFAVLAGSDSLLQKIIVMLCYLAPTIALLALGRAGNISLVIVTVVITILLYLHILSKKKSVVDGLAPAA